MLEVVTHLRRELLAVEVGERRSLARRQADALAVIHKARRAMARAALTDATERRERLRRLADAAVRP